MIDVSNDIESLNKQRNENLIAIKELDQKIREVNDEIMKQKDVITAGLESEQLNTDQAKKCSNVKSTGRAHEEVEIQWWYALFVMKILRKIVTWRNIWKENITKKKILNVTHVVKSLFFNGDWKSIS